MKMRKILAMVMALALTAALAVGGTLAYLTSQDSVTNTFTVGKVNITLDEADVDEYGVEIPDASRTDANEYKLLPGHTYVKDPIVHVTAGSENSYLFVKVENGISGLEATGNTTIAAQLAANNWKLVSGNVYVYAEGDATKTAVTAGANKPVFASFVIAGNADLSVYSGDTPQALPTVNVTAYAVQADGFAEKTPDEIWSSAGFSA